MPPVSSRRSFSSIPTLLSLSRLIQSLPRSSTSDWKRSTTQWAIESAAQTPIEPEDPPDSPEFWFKLGLSVVLVLLGGVFAGLTLALMGSDDLNLRVLSTSSDDPKERKAAGKVLRLLGRGRHWVLVVLLLGNVIVNESLPIFLDDVLGGGLYAVIVSTTMIVIFGEIIPQAVCVRYGLAIGGVCAPFVLCLMILFSPVAYPIAKLLDRILGKDEGHTYKKAELKSFLQFHREGTEPLRDDEIGILNGVLSLNEKHVKEIMTPINDCLTLSANKVLDHDTIDQILLSGFSRIPIHEPGQPDNFVGMLLVKRLITYNPEDAWPISKFNLLPLPEAKPTINCFQALDFFQTGRAHLLLISETPGTKGGALGIVSLEDLIEELIGEEIVDETDRYQDNRSHKVAKRNAGGAVMRGIIERHRAQSRRASASSPHPGQKSTNLAYGGYEAILVQLSDKGNIVAEPIAMNQAGNEGTRLSGDGQGTKFTVNNANGGKSGANTTLSVPPADHIDSISEAGSSTANGGIATGIIGEAVNAPADLEHLIKVVEQDAADDIMDNSVIDSGVTTDIGYGVDGSDVKDAGKDEGNGEGSNHKGDITSKKGKKKAQGQQEESGGALDAILDMPFPSHRDFEIAAKSLVNKYKDVDGEQPGPSRTNTGWEWREHKKKQFHGQGYLARRMTRYLPTPQKPKTPGDVMLDDHDDLETDELLGAKDDNYSSAEPSQTRDEGDQTLEKVEVEQHIVYSRTYHVPQLMLRAWDSDGSPLRLTSLFSLSLLRPSSQIQPPPEDSSEREDVLLLDPHSPFPLLQQIEHPTTGDIVWSVHPCQVSQAVEEVFKAEQEEEVEIEMARGNVAILESEGSEDGNEERRLKWLETWMMITSGVVDLSID